MIALSPRLRLTLLAVVVLGAGLVYTLEVADWHEVEAVSLDGAMVEDWESQLGLVAEKPLLEQPLDKVAAGILEDENTARVDIEYDLPGTIEIQTNRFEPVCLLLDKRSRRLLGLNHLGRILPLGEGYDDWEHPIVTGVVAGGVFDLCDDPRVPLLVEQLVRLEDDNIELYRLIDEVDLSTPEYATVTLSGLSFQLRVSAADLHAQTGRFVEFLENYEPEIDSARTIDLRYANMIVQKSRRN